MSFVPFAHRGARNLTKEPQRPGTALFYAAVRASRSPVSMINTSDFGKRGPRANPVSLFLLLSGALLLEHLLDDLLLLDQECPHDSVLIFS